MILVTGASGVLGVALLEEARRAHGEAKGVTSADVDLGDFDATLALFEKAKPELVFHAAARVHGLMGNTRFPYDIYTQNVRINTNVVEAARRTGCKRFVGVGTVAAYPDNQPFPIREDMFWNGPPHSSERAYAQSKRALLAQLEACKAQYGMEFLYPICTNLFGPHDRFDETYGHVVPSLISKFHDAAAAGKSATVWGTGKARRDFLYAADAAAAIVSAAQSLSGPINIVSGETVPIRRVVECLASVARVKDVVWDDTKPDGQLDRSYDASRLQQLGFRPKHSLEDGLKATFDWYKSNYPNVRR